MRRPAYMPTPVPTILAINAVMIPTRAPSHQPTAPPRLAPRNVNSLDTAPYLLTHPAGRHAAVSVNEKRAGRYDLVHRLHDAYLLSRPVDSPHSPQHVRDLSYGRPRPHRIENRLHQRGRGIAPRRLQRLQSPLHASRLPRPALLRDASALRQRQRRILRRRHRRDVLLVRVLVHADD